MKQFTKSVTDLQNSLINFTESVTDFDLIIKKQVFFVFVRNPDRNLNESARNLDNLDHVCFLAGGHQVFVHQVGGRSGTPQERSSRRPSILQP